MEMQQIAALCHEVNRAYCQSLGDDGQPPWEEAGDWQKNSAINGVLYHTNNPDAKPADSHNSWMKKLATEGWKYGKEKDVEKKEHPCFVPYSDLPPAQKAKDYIFKAICDFFKAGKKEEGVDAPEKPAQVVSPKLGESKDKCPFRGDFFNLASCSPACIMYGKDEAKCRILGLVSPLIPAAGENRKEAAPEAPKVDKKKTTGKAPEKK